MKAGRVAKERKGAEEQRGEVVGIALQLAAHPNTCERALFATHLTMSGTGGPLALLLR
jgi:hypothetical protein